MDIPTIMPPVAERADRQRQLLELYQRHHRAILAQVRRRVPPQDVEDVLCDVLDGLLPRLEGLYAFSELRQAVYIRSVTRNAVADYMRRAVRTRARFVDVADADLERLSDGADSVEETVLRREQVERMKEAIRALPDDRRALLEMKYVQELDDGEIAARLGVSCAAVRQQLSRLRKRLRRTMEEEERQ